jgi:hypothetical protein
MSESWTGAEYQLPHPMWYQFPFSFRVLSEALSPRPSPFRGGAPERLWFWFLSPLGEGAEQQPPRRNQYQFPFSK